jgi:hypothetical protein
LTATWLARIKVKSNLPFSIQATLILCCLGCAIFGITEVSTDGVEFDTGEATGSIDASEDISSPQAACLGVNYDYVPPRPAEQSFVDLEPDPEKGILKPNVIAPSRELLTAAADLLDDSKKVYGSADIENQTDIDDLD